MRRPGRRGLAAVALVGALASVPVAAPAVSRAGAACAASAGSHAGLVIDTGSHVLEYCVALDSGSVSGLHLLELAHAQYGLSYGFGLGGQAVCRLDGVGPAGDDCFADYPDYWGYWHGDGHGGWTWASTGAGEASIRSGDLDGWTWGSGDSATTHPAPPATAIDRVCPPAATPAATTAAPAGGPSTAPTTHAPTPMRTSSTQRPAASSASPRPAATHSRHAPSPSRSLEPSTETTSVDVHAAAPAAPPSSGGPPGGVVAAIALAALLGAGGWLRMRSRSRGPA